MTKSAVQFNHGCAHVDQTWTAPRVLPARPDRPVGRRSGEHRLRSFGLAEHDPAVGVGREVLDPGDRGVESDGMPVGATQTPAGGRLAFGFQDSDPVRVHEC
jgi:hypothetical protein